jgi:hypothetical protein
MNSITTDPTTEIHAGRTDMLVNVDRWAGYAIILF